MYNNSSRSNSRFSSSNRSSGGGRLFSGSRPSFGGNRKRPSSKFIDPAKFVKKASLIQNEEVYVPQNTFEDFTFQPSLKKNILAKGYLTPTPIQDQAIPHILEGKDLVGIANTGTGKTAAFVLPIIDKIYRNKSQKALIIAPTRELALQIEEEMRSFTNFMHIYSVLCIGGTNIRNQIYNLKRNPHVIIGTPGRLKDLFNQGYLHLDDVTTITLDEVDRMLDMGFIKDIKFLISQLPLEHQSLFFSATISPEIKTLITTLLKDPVTVAIKSVSSTENVDQDVIRVKDKKEKVEKLHDVLLKEEVKKTIIFGRTKRGVEELTISLIKRGFKAVSIHGDKPQHKRQRALSMFKDSQMNILVSTDVAARGIDVADITHVINFDIPENFDDYTHRIGRTGRANRKGVALTFIEGR